MNYKLLKLITGFALLCSALNLSAQTIFDVEIVFFKRIGDLHLTGQQEPIPLENEENQFVIDDSNSLLPEGYTLLQRKQQKLEGVYHRLRASTDMRPLLHIGWRQELQDKADTPWLNFSLQDQPEQDGLVDFQGIIRLSRNQGLVLESQVVGFKEAPYTNAPAAGELVTEQKTDSNKSEELDLPFDMEPNKEKELDSDLSGQEEFNENLQIPDALSGFFEMSETIKVKLGKLYYIDHPTMGLLVKVTPYQASLEEQEALN